MTDSTSDVISIDRCGELMGAEADGEEQIAAVRDHADAMAHFIVGVFLEQQAAGARTTTPAAFDDAGSIPVWFQTRHRFEWRRRACGLSAAMFDEAEHEAAHQLARSSSTVWWPAHSVRPH